MKRPQDTIDKLYEREYKPLGIKKQQVAKHGIFTAICLIAYLWLSAIVLEPFMQKPETGFLATGGFILGLILLLKMIAREDPIEVKSEEVIPTAEDYWKPLDNWLKAKGSPLSGKDAYEVGVQYKIDPDFLIAVTKAETQLCTVKQRGSQFNCGSVGSYDSTNTTYQANSYRHGFEQIAQTVNNKLLGGYTNISQLSRTHNRTGHVYATSEMSWFVNVRNTMRELKNQPQAEDFRYRLTN